VAAYISSVLVMCVCCTVRKFIHVYSVKDVHGQS
jgi:hypothetical protein